MSEQIVKCKNILKKHNKERECDRFLFKLIDNDKLYFKCPSCGASAIAIGRKGGGLDVIHVNEGEDILCQTK